MKIPIQYKLSSVSNRLIHAIKSEKIVTNAKPTPTDMKIAMIFAIEKSLLQEKNKENVFFLKALETAMHFTQNANCLCKDDLSNVR